MSPWYFVELPMTADGGGQPVMDVTIIDCGIGNVKSVLRMFEWVDATAQIVSDPADAADCSRLVLPGVGAFDAGITALTAWRRRLTTLRSSERSHPRAFASGCRCCAGRARKGRREG